MHFSGSDLQMCVFVVDALIFACLMFIFLIKLHRTLSPFGNNVCAVQKFSAVNNFLTRKHSDVSVFSVIIIANFIFLLSTECNALVIYHNPF